MEGTADLRRERRAKLSAIRTLSLPGDHAPLVKDLYIKHSSRPHSTVPSNYQVGIIPYVALIPQNPQSLSPGYSMLIDISISPTYNIPNPWVRKLTEWVRSKYLSWGYLLCVCMYGTFFVTTPPTCFVGGPGSTARGQPLGTRSILTYCILCAL